MHALAKVAPLARVLKPGRQVKHGGLKLVELSPAENVPARHVAQPLPPKPGRQTGGGRGTAEASGVVNSAYQVGGRDVRCIYVGLHQIVESRSW